MIYSNDKSSPSKKEVKQMVQGTVIMFGIALAVSFLILLGLFD